MFLRFDVALIRIKTYFNEIIKYMMQEKLREARMGKGLN